MKVHTLQNLNSIRTLHIKYQKKKFIIMSLFL